MCRESLKNFEFFKLVLNFYFSPVFRLLEQGIYVVYVLDLSITLLSFTPKKIGISFKPNKSCSRFTNDHNPYI